MFYCTSAHHVYSGDIITIHVAYINAIKHRHCKYDVCTNVIKYEMKYNFAIESPN